MAEIGIDRGVPMPPEYDRGRAALNAAPRGGEDLLLEGAVVPPAEPGDADYVEPDPALDPAAWPITDPQSADMKSANERRLHRLEGVDPAIADLISDAELDEIEAEERSRAQAERKKKALASVRESLRQKARVENDLISADRLLSDADRKRRNTQTTFRINLPRGGGALGLRVDGFLYQQGTTYTRPLAVAESLANQHYRVWLEEIKLTTLDQHKRGNSAVELAGQKIPPFYVDEGR